MLLSTSSVSQNCWYKKRLWKRCTLWLLSDIHWFLHLILSLTSHLGLLQESNWSLSETANTQNVSMFSSREEKENKKNTFPVILGRRKISRGWLCANPPLQGSTYPCARGFQKDLSSLLLEEQAQDCRTALYPSPLHTSLCVVAELHPAFHRHIKGGVSRSGAVIAMVLLARCCPPPGCGKPVAGEGRGSTSTPPLALETPPRAASASVWLAALEIGCTAGFQMSLFKLLVLAVILGWKAEMALNGKNAAKCWAGRHRHWYFRKHELKS